MEFPVYDREFGGHRPAWEELTPEQQEKWVTDMATYAAMIEVMDQGIGEVIEAVGSHRGCGRERDVGEYRLSLFER